jgi:hypothetical protein
MKPYQATWDDDGDSDDDYKEDIGDDSKCRSAEYVVCN